jgi:hypothetical protein
MITIVRLTQASFTVTTAVAVAQYDYSRPLTSASPTVTTAVAATHNMITIVRLTPASPTVTTAVTAQHDYISPFSPGFPYRRNNSSSSSI